jgi:hypothetical protein
VEVESGWKSLSPAFRRRCNMGFFQVEQTGHSCFDVEERTSGKPYERILYRKFLVTNTQPGRVGSCISLFEACSAFTHVTACTLAKSPCDPLRKVERDATVLASMLRSFRFCEILHPFT